MGIIKKVRFSLRFLIFSLFISSCIVENANIPKKQQVIIFSDCLHQKDEKIFNSFKNRYHISVKIVYFNTEELIKKIRFEGINTNADLIIFGSIVSANNADKHQLFNPINSDIIDELIDQRFQSKNKTWFGIGIDPYLLIVKNKAKIEPEKYSDLLTSEYKNKWSSSIQNADDLTPFISCVFRIKKRNKLNEYYKNFIENELYLGSDPKDYLNTYYSFAFLSTYVKEIQNNDSLNNIYHPLFLNQTINGAYYNLHCAGIVKQARNYENAKLLLEYISTSRFNERINNVWKTVPISMHKRIHPFEYQNIDFNIYTANVSKQVLNYRFVKKMIQKNQKDKTIEFFNEPVESIISDSTEDVNQMDSLSVE